MQVLHRDTDITLRFSPKKQKYYVYIGEEKWYGHQYFPIVYKEYRLMRRQRTMNLSIAMSRAS